MMKNSLLIWQLTDRGFCSEINMMLFAYLYSLEKGLDFALCSDAWNSSHQLGWQDYFQPFCQDIAQIELERKYLLSPDNFRTRVSRIKRKILLYGTTRRSVLSNNDVWQSIWNEEFVESSFHIPKQFLQGDCFTCCQEIIRRIWRFNETTQQAVLRTRKSIGLGAAPYFALHIRRGDKIKEANYTPVHQYISKVKKINEEFSEPLERCFVMTDDYQVIAELELECPDWKFFSLCNTYQFGHNQSEFNSSSPEVRQSNVIKLLTELYVVQESNFFVGTYSSNISRFLSLFMGKEKTHSVDIPFTMFYEPKEIASVVS